MSVNRIKRAILAARTIGRIRKLRKEPAAKAVPELQKLLQDPAVSKEVIVPLLFALGRFGPAAAVVLPLVEKLTQPDEAAKIRKVAEKVLAVHAAVPPARLR